jgi:hypothetical protein
MNFHFVKLKYLIFYKRIVIMKHENIINKKIFIGFLFIFCIGNTAINSVRLDPGFALLNSSKDNKNNRLHTQNVFIFNKNFK